MAEVRNARWHGSAPITWQREHSLCGTLICLAQTSSSPTVLPIQTHQKYSVAAKLPMPNLPYPAGEYPLTNCFREWASARPAITQPPHRLFEGRVAKINTQGS